MKMKNEGESIAKPRGRRARAAEPLEVKLTLRYRFGDEPGDSVTMMDDRAVPMVDSVFKNRDKILRGLAMSLIRAGASQPKVLSEMVPVLKLLPGSPRKSRNKT